VTPLGEHGPTWIEPKAEVAHPLDEGQAASRGDRPQTRSRSGDNERARSDRTLWTRGQLLPAYWRLGIPIRSRRAVRPVRASVRGERAARVFDRMRARFSRAWPPRDASDTLRLAPWPSPFRARATGWPFPRAARSESRRAASLLRSLGADRHRDA
jgi:hypothetical protein